MPQLAQHVEGVGEVHRRQRLPHASRKIRAGERGIVRAHPAAQRDLHTPCDKADACRKAYRTRFAVLNELEGMQREPGKKRERRHAAEEVGGDDRGLEQHRDRPLAQRRLKNRQGEDPRREAGRLARAPGEKVNCNDEQTEASREVAVAHLLPCLGMRDVVRHVRRDGLAVAQRPIRAAQAGIGEPHVCADHHDHEGKCERREYESAIVAHPIPEYFSSRSRSLTMRDGSGFGAKRIIRLPSGSMR